MVGPARVRRAAAGGVWPGRRQQQLWRIQRPGERRSRNGGTLTVALADDPDVLDPTLARTLVGRTVFTSPCEKLYDIDKDLNVVPQLAASMPETSPDAKTVTIKLRQGVKFNDGTDFDAAAVKKSLAVPAEDLRGRLQEGRRGERVRRLAAAGRVRREHGGLTRRGPPMSAYVLRRAGQSLVTLLPATLVVFLGIRALPGDPAAVIAGEEQDPVVIAQIREKYGLDRPVPVQY
ncbi:MAG TPA: ABC transporter substrate-binding protein [Actinomycetes bacterium]|jgi:hypothetical protein|nr:ABC transporter substrate-binding protein [Actinomycetes bacterium]